MSDSKQPTNSTINLAEKFKLFNDHWSPRVIAELNDYQFKLAKFKGAFDWHKHTDTDEAFIVIEGTMLLGLRDQQDAQGQWIERELTLTAGEMYVVPKNIEHRPAVAGNGECHVMMIEPKGVVNTGDAIDSDKTAANDIWV